MDRVFSRPEFEGVYWYYSRFSGVKPGRCPGCGQDLQLTKHHVVPKKNGGKGMRQNYFYLCRKCHDWIHDMFSKVSKIIAYVQEHPSCTIAELMMKFRTTKRVVIAAVYPDYYGKCEEKYHIRVSKKVSQAMAMLD